MREPIMFKGEEPKWFWDKAIKSFLFHSRELIKKSFREVGKHQGRPIRDIYRQFVHDLEQGNLDIDGDYCCNILIYATSALDAYVLVKKRMKEIHDCNFDSKTVFYLLHLSYQCSRLQPLIGGRDLLSPHLTSEMAKLAASRRWNKKRAAIAPAIRAAIEIAEKQWEDGSAQYHNEMAHYVAKVPEVSELIRQARKQHHDISQRYVENQILEAVKGLAKERFPERLFGVKQEK